jgi:two-component system, response regulator PdtaR
MTMRLWNHVAPSGGKTVVGARADRVPRHELAEPATILIVEDEVLVRMTIAQELRFAGFNVFEASNADEAVDLLRSQCVHVLFSDIQMPGTMDGAELARAVRSRFPGIKVLLTSAESFSEGHCAENDGFFPKPYDPRGVIEHIKMLMG